MQANVLIIEDETELAELINLYLEKEGITTLLAGSAEEGLDLLNTESVDLIILDINLPGMDGFEFLSELRRESTTPVIIVSARESDEDIIMGLGSGADEFVTKPFATKVLVARIRAMLRRSRMTGSTTDPITFGDFALDPDGYFLTRDGNRVPLSSREFEVLRFFVLNNGKSFTPAQVYKEVWGNAYGDLTAIAVYVRRIRNKIEDDPKNPQYLQTIHGQGYRFILA